MNIVKKKFINFQEMEYMPSQCFNTNVQTRPLLTKAYKIDCFINCSKKGCYSAIKYIKIFQNPKALAISVVNTYTDDKLMHTFLENFHQGGEYSDHIASHKS